MDEIRIEKISAKDGEDIYCASGEEGEVLIAGDSLMNGYASDDGTEVAIDGEGYLHTGDIGYLDEDGYLCICGRKKNIIIKGGENILPAEIESCISELESVENAIVLGVPDEKFGEQIAAYVVPKPGGTVTLKDVQNAVSRHLTRFKQPEYLFLYDSFPVNMNGKPDLVKLKEKYLEKFTDPL